MEKERRNISIQRQNTRPTRGRLLGLLEPVSLGLVAAIAVSVAVTKAWSDELAYQFRVVAHVGSAAPGGGAFVADFEPTALNNRGQLAFTAEPEVAGREGVFVAGREIIQQLMRSGQSVPGGGIASAYALGNIGLNDSGDAAFAFSLEPLDFGPPVNSGLYRWSNRTRTLVAAVIPNVTPDPLGGVLGGVNFDVSLNNRGDVVFSGFVTNTPLGAGQAVFVQRRDGALRTIVRPGDPSPDGGTFVLSGLAPSTAWINDAGDVVFLADTTLDPDASHGKVYTYRAATGTIELIPSPTDVVRYGSIGINNRGNVVLGGHYAPRGLGGVYLRSHDQTSLIARTGDPAPGGGTFRFITGAGYDGQIAISDRGDIAFDAAVTLPDGSIDEAVYYYSGEHRELRRLAGIGTVIPGYGTIQSLEQVGALIAPGVPVTGVPFSYIALNDRGEVGFAATVTDGVTVYGVLLLGKPGDE